MFSLWPWVKYTLLPFIVSKIWSSNLNSEIISSTSASQLPLTHIILSFNGFRILITSFGLYDKGNIFNHKEVRERKLLLHKKEIIKLSTKVSLEGLTIIPLEVYISKGFAKIKIGLCKGKKLYDKREDIKKEEAKKELISIDDFAKVELKVGEILESKQHENADKLLVSKIKIGTEIRQIVSGIAKYYNPKDLIGRKVVVVTNLKPVKIRGVESNGMVLCAADGEKLEIVEIKEATSGSTVR